MVTAAVSNSSSSGRRAVREWGCAREPEGKITCSQECWAVLWVSSGRLVAISMKTAEEPSESVEQAAFQGWFCCLPRSSQAAVNYMDKGVYSLDLDFWRSKGKVRLGLPAGWNS